MTPLLVNLAVKTTLLLVLAWSVTHTLRRAPAATRHLVWTVALGALLLLPALSLTLPAFAPAAIGPAVSHTVLVVRAAAPLPTPAAPRTLPAWPPFVWMAGSALVAAWFLAGALRLRRIERAARPVDSLFVEVRETPAVTVPLVWGLWRPVILLPAGASEWPPERRRLVLLHEFAHVLRRDGWTQALVQLVCAVYWFHPLVWFAAHRLRQEREQACDDHVLNAGAKPSDYASHLLHFARSLRHAVPAPGALPMAARSRFEGRLLAILEEGRRRDALRPRTVLLVLTAALAVLAPLAALRALPPAGGVAGAVYDISGAVIPEAGITLLDKTTGQTLSTKTAPDGEFRFPSLPSGRYQMTVAAPGFRYHLQTVNVPDAARPVRLDVVLQPGEVRESIEVRGSGRVASPARPRRVRVGGNIQTPKLLASANPRYPENARAAGIEGAVLIRTVIRMDGSTAEPVVLNSPDPDLARSAVDAVRQWRYQPALLNGVPIESVTTITINFLLDDSQPQSWCSPLTSGRAPRPGQPARPAAPSLLPFALCLLPCLLATIEIYAHPVRRHPWRRPPPPPPRKASGPPHH